MIAFCVIFIISSIICSMMHSCIPRCIARLMKHTISLLVDQFMKLSGHVMFDDSSVGKTACDVMSALLCA